MEKLANLLTTVGTVIVGSGIVLNSFFYTVDEGERAIIFDKLIGGLREKVIGEGMHFYLPVI